MGCDGTREESREAKSQVETCLYSSLRALEILSKIRDHHVQKKDVRYMYQYKYMENVRFCMTGIISTLLPTR